MVVRPPRERALRQIDAQVEVIDAELGRLVKDDATLQGRFDSLSSIPGIGAVTALALLIKIPELGNLENSAAASLAGLAPVTPQSGQWKGRSVIAGGRAAIRQALYMPALVAICFNPGLKAKYQALVAAGKPAKVAIVAVMRKLVILANVLLSTGRTRTEKPLDQDDYSIISTANSLSRLRDPFASAGHHLSDTSEAEASAQKWAELVQSPPYRFPNCWGPRLEQFWLAFDRARITSDFVFRAADAYPNLIFYQVAAEDLASDPAVKLRFAKRAFWLAGFDLHIQERFYNASLVWGAGDRPNLPDRSLPFTCRRPFETLELSEAGAVSACCSGWLPEIVGWMQAESLDNIWNGDIINRQRRQIAVGDYSSCSALLCPYFHDKTREVRRRYSIYEPLKSAQSPTHVASSPTSLHLSNDPSCNLRCPSCRTRTIVASKPDTDRINSLHLPALLDVLPKLERIWITGSGDPFASKHFRGVLSLLKSPPYRHILIDIQTNGVLFDEREWSRFEFDGRVGVVIVSIDAGTPETYAKVREGGDWNRLMRNLEFLGRKRLEGQIDHLRLDAVIQASNFREISKIVQIGAEKGVDQCYFSILTNWGHLGWEKFSDAFVFSADHPDFLEFCGIYDSLRTHDLIDWGNLPRWTRARSR